MARLTVIVALPLSVILLLGGAFDMLSVPTPATAAASPTQPVLPLGAAPAAGCTVPDPTGTGGCITPTTAWLLTQMYATFGALPATCWDAHAWNPTSDHPKGKACDVFFGKTGTFPGPADVARGWALATWLQTNAAALHVSYVIWQGHIWSPARATQGWRIYNGAGVYNPSDPTGGHYDHVHVSVTS